MLKKLGGKVRSIVSRLFKVSTAIDSKHPPKFITNPNETFSITCVGGGGSGGGIDTNKDLKIVDTVEKPSDVFNAALDYLWDGVGNSPNHLSVKTKYICHCIDRSSRTSTFKKFCKDVIEERLGNNNTLCGWIISNKHATWVEIANNPAKLQETRRQWLISLRDEFKAKGM